MNLRRVRPDWEGPRCETTIVHDSGLEGFVLRAVQKSSGISRMNVCSEEKKRNSGEGGRDEWPTGDAPVERSAYTTGNGPAPTPSGLRASRSEN